MKTRTPYKILSYAIVTVAVVIFLFPIFWLILGSLKPNSEVLEVGLPSRLTVDSYTEVLSTFPVWLYLRNSVGLALGSTFLSLFTGSIAAYGLARYRFRGRRLIIGTTLVMRSLPGIALAVPLFLLFAQIRLNNTFQGVLLAHTAIQLPLVIWIMIGFLQELPGELIDAGLVDGCTRRDVMTHIILPLAAPGLAVSAIFAFLVSWNNFDLTLTLAATPSLLTMPVGMSQMNLLYGIRWDLLSAAATLYIVPTIALALLLQRYIVRGLTLGAIKG